jgi:hypothetical protein
MIPLRHPHGDTISRHQRLVQSLPRLWYILMGLSRMRKRCIQKPLGLAGLIIVRRAERPMLCFEAAGPRRVVGNNRTRCKRIFLAMFYASGASSLMTCMRQDHMHVAEVVVRAPKPQSGGGITGRNTCGCGDASD